MAQKTAQYVEHFVTITHTTKDSGINVVVGHIPEQISMGFGGTWSQGFVGKIGEGFVSGINQVLGYRGAALGAPILSALQYKGPKHPAMKITLEFNAETDGYQDVMVPVYKLICMCTPKVAGTLSIALPGPNAADELKKVIDSSYGGSSQGGGDSNGNSSKDGDVKATSEKISIQIGTVAKYESIIIDDLNLTFDSIVDTNRKPIYCKADITFRPFIIPYRDDLRDVLMIKKD